MTYSDLSYLFTEAFKDWIKLLKMKGEFPIPSWMLCSAV